MTGRGQWRRRLDLVRVLLVRDIRLRYRRSVLGVLWSQLGPLATLGVVAFVFTQVVPLDIANYAVFAFTGLLVWAWFSDGLVAATHSVVEGRDLVRRPGFPNELLPAVSVSTHLVQFLLAWPVLLAAVLLDVGAVPVTVAALPLIVLVQAAVMLAPAYALAAVHVRFRDIGHLVGVALLPLFWASPVFYAPDSVPDRLQSVYRLNPMVWLIEAYRDVLMRGRWPAWEALLLLVAVAGLVGVVSVRRYRVRSHRFAEEL